ncbi:MAG TPA: YchJ family metal-binding protein [Opitutaceae bacterium]|nr:YchJ family metal-binding protein [Opitutaceae bacterium]
MASDTKENPARNGQPCPCGSGQLFEACCGPLLAGARQAATPEQLMRARFTAHVAHDFKFLHDTHRPTAGKPYVPEEGEPAVTWTRLEVHGAESAPNNPDKGYVEFTAHGTQEGRAHVLQEKAEFVRAGGIWLYNREARLGPAPYKATNPKVGRNDPCPCGSGKKFKHCCLAKT